MGTNFYHHTNVCECCGRYDIRHIGKSSAGWQFEFQSVRDEEDEHLVIKSYHQWIEELENCGKIVDEYGKEHTVDEFKKLVESKRDSYNYKTVPSESRNRLTSLLSNTPGQWIDEDGHPFSDYEFP